MPIKTRILLHSDGPALDPERWPSATMERRRASSIGRVWRSLYQQDPISQDGNLFKDVWWQIYEAWELPQISRAAIIVDSAYKIGVASDFSVCASWVKGVDGHVYLIDVVRKKAEFPELILMVHECAAKLMKDPRKFPKPSIVIEDRASGQALVPLIRKPYTHPDTGEIMPSLHSVPWKHHLEGLRGTASKVSRMEAITPWVMEGRAHIPAKASWREEWLDEHRAAPTGKHDDQVDTTVMALDYFLGYRIPEVVTSGKLIDRDLRRQTKPTARETRVQGRKEREEQQELERWKEMGLIEE